MDLTLPGFAISSDPFLGIAGNSTSNITCTIIGIDWSTGARSCINERGVVFLAFVVFGILAGTAMLWCSAIHDDADQASKTAVYDLERDPFRMFARWPGWPWEKTSSTDEQDGEEGQETRHDSVQESRPLLHTNDAAWCDYCTMVQQRREQQIAEYGCNV